MAGVAPAVIRVPLNEVLHPDPNSLVRLGGSLGSFHGTLIRLLLGRTMIRRPFFLFTQVGL